MTTFQAGPAHVRASEAVNIAANGTILCTPGGIANVVRRTPMASTWRNVALATLLVIAGAAIDARAQSSGRLLYQYEVVGKTGDAVGAATISAIGQSPSVNARGVVAFQAGLSTGGNGLFVGAPGAALPTNINPSFSAPSTRVFSAAVQINNANQVVARDQVPGAPPANFVRFWDGNAADAFVTLARGGSGQPFDSVFAFPSANDNGDVVFAALDATLGNVLATPVTQGSTTNYNKIALTTPLLPKIGFSGKVAVRAGGTAAAPLRLYDNNLASFVPIAGAGTALFTSVGRAPGINDSGSVVVFAGDRGNGNGVFASVDIGGGVRKILKIAGEGTVGVTPLSVTGTAVVPPDLGYDDALQPVGFASIPLDSRVGVAHQALGPAGLDGDSFVVSFVATAPAVTQTDYYLAGVDFTANRGIWTVRVDVFSKGGELRFRLGPPMPVVQIGDVVQAGGQAYTIDQLPDLYDPIANVASDDGTTLRPVVAGEHYLTFWAASGSIQLVVRAKQTDTCLTRVQRMPQGGGNASWASQKYAFSTVETIAGKGCAMTSFSMQTNALFLDNGVNRSFDPLAMNNFMKAGHTFEQEPSPPKPKPTLVNSAKTVAALNPLAEVTSRSLTIVYAEVPGKSWQYDPPSRKGVLDASLLPGALALIDAGVCGERAPIRVAVEVSCQKVRIPNPSPPPANITDTDVDGGDLCEPIITNQYIPGIGMIPLPETFPGLGIVKPKSVSPGHHIIVAGKVGNNYFLADPGHKTRKLLGAPPYNNTFELRGVVVDPPDASFITAVVSANADLYLTSPQQQSTGIDPGTGVARYDIPGSSYVHDMYDTLDIQDDADELFSTLYILNPAPGTYSLTIVETGTGPYFVTIDIARPDGGLQTPLRIDGVATPGVRKTYQLVVNTTSGGTPVVTPQSVAVPDVARFTQANGTALIVAAGLVLGTVTPQASATVPAGEIISQNPLAGTPVSPGSAVNIVVSTGAGGTIVPNVVNLTQSAATAAITGAGLVLGAVTQATSPSVPAGSVISQNPTAGTSVAPGSAVALLVSLGPQCSTFTDVASSSLFCANVDWLKNRGITLGCTSTSVYCPADPVTRLAMAAFMNRLGTALTATAATQEAAPGSVVAGAGNVVCQSADTAITGFPRRAYVDAVFAATAAGATEFGADVVASLDGGATWSNLNTQLSRATTKANRWTNLRAFGERDLNVGQSVRFGLRITRGSQGGTATLTDSRCHLRALFGNRNGTSVPFDPLP